MAYSLPKTAASTTVAAWLQALDDSVEISEGLFYGSAAPSHKNGRRWLDTTSGYVLKISIGGVWYTLFETANATGGGLVRAAAGAFTTAAPTSAVAASGATELVRKNEADSRTRVAVVPIGTVSASGNYNVFVTPPGTTSIVDVRLLVTTTVAISAADYWIARAYNVTAANALQSGTVGPPPTGVILAGSSYSPGGAAFTADTEHALGVDQNITGLAAGKTIRVELTKQGAAANLANLVALVYYRVTT